MKEYLLPIKIVEQKGLKKGELLFKNDGLYGFYESDTSKWDNYCKIEGLGSYLVLDFGKEMNGGVRITTGWIYYGDCKVRIRFGESLGEVNSSIGEKNSSNAHGPRDFETTICAISDVWTGNTGFRFVRIDLLEDKYIYLRNIFCENNILKKKPIYTYQGKDELIKQIFETAKRTVDLCAGCGYVWDGIKRDRLVWVGDLAPEVMALSSIYGRVKEIEKSLDLAKKHTPLPGFMNCIATYSAWWIIILCDYCEQFKLDDYLKSNLTYLVKLIDLLANIVDKDGNFDSQFRYLVDWPTKDTEDEEAGIRAIFLYALNKAEVVLLKFGKSVENVKLVKGRLNRKDIVVKRMKQVVALKYFAKGSISDEEYELLISGRAKGLSTFMSYFILTAIASRDKELAVEIMKEYYGAMLERGATTFWEDFSVDWLDGSGKIDEIDPNKKDIHGDYGAHCYVGFRHSLCHGWSAGVVKFIKENC